MAEGVVLVTGGNRGIGRAVALDLARHGADVAVHYGHNREAAEAVVAEIRALSRRAIAVPADLREKTLPEGFIEGIEGELGPVARLVCSAGVFQEGLGAFLDLDDWDETQAVNLRSVVLVCQALLPGMLRRKAGSIVLIGSEAALAGSPGLGAYAASKAGLIGFAKSLAAEVGPRGLRVNVVSPGFVDTEMLSEMTPDARRKLAERTALGRFGRADEIAPAVRFLLSEEASYITGTVLSVNGGLLGL